MNKRLTFIIGGARAGKSSYAERLARDSERVLFVATAEAKDDDMRARIANHRANRPDHWDTLEEPLHLVEALPPLLSRYDTILLDCLNLWVSNLMLQDSPAGDAPVDVQAETRRLLDCYRAGDASWIVVSNEVGLGLVPTTPLGRAFRDQLGWANQIFAAAADDVYFMAAGLPLNLKRLSDDADENRPNLATAARGVNAAE